MFVQKYGNYYQVPGLEENYRIRTTCYQITIDGNLDSLVYGLQLIDELTGTSWQGHDCWIEHTMHDNVRDAIADKRSILHQHRVIWNDWR